MKIPQSHCYLKSYRTKMSKTLNETPLTEDKFKKTFKSLKSNKVSGPDIDQIQIQIFL